MTDGWTVNEAIERLRNYLGFLRSRGATQVEGQVKEISRERITAKVKFVAPKPADHITLTFKVPESD